MSRRAGRTVVAAVVIGAALLVGNAMLSVSNTRQLREESGRILHSNEVLLALDNVLALVRDAETGQRGYVITGKPEYLVPYQVAVASINQEMDRLERLIRDDRVQAAAMVDVRHRIGAKLGELALSIGLRERKGFDLTKEVMILGAGRDEMEALRSTVAAMAGHETRMLMAHEATADRTYRSTLVSELVAGVAAVLALLGFSFLLVRHLAARDRAEATIAAQGERLRTTLASIGDAVVTTDIDARVTNLNPVAESLTGWSSAEAAGEPLDAVFRIVNESTRERVASPAVRALREGIVVGLANHTLLIRKDGAHTPIDDSAAPIRNADGQVLGCVLVFRDISERKAAERALADAQARLRRVVTDMPIPTMVYAEDGEIVLVNGAWTGITGYAASELTTTLEWTRRAYGARAGLMNAVLASLFDLRASTDNGEREILTASGERHLWHFVTAPLGRDDRGRRLLVTNAVDVTERRRLDSALLEREERLGLAMDAADYGGWEWQRDASTLSWTDKTRELLGIGADEPASMEMFQSRIHPDDRERRALAVAAAWQSGVHGNEYRVLRPDGEVRWISSRGRVVRSVDGERLVGVIRDITEQKRAVEALQAADRRKDEFLATLAHELRNPLAPLRNSLAIVQR
ncbi:MAG: PAS domain S-box protein, partial [Caldimonas sp.]